MRKIPEHLQDDILKNDPNGTNDDVSVTLDEIESFGDNSSLKEMVVDISKYRSMLKERITFINDSLTAAIPFTRENLYLLCAYSGNGKSTVAANVSYPLWQQGKNKD